MSFHIAPDGDGELTLWRTDITQREPKAICRQCDTPLEVWANVIVGMAGMPRHV